MDHVGIENQARSLLARIYREEQESRPGVLSPMQMIEPEFVASYLGYDLTYVPGLGNWGRDGSQFEIAGLIDKQRRIIRISEKFRRDAGRFTAAHEIGHIVLEHAGTVIHRDRPVFDIPRSVRERAEREADYFAACLLAPRRLLEREFKKRFGDFPLHPTEDVVFNLTGSSSHALMRAGRSGYDFESAVANARRFNGVHFRSLAESFNISTGAMALRLRELRLVDA